MDQIIELRNKLREWNKAYRSGKPIVSDAEYDLKVEELETLSPNDVFFNEVGFIPNDDIRKQKLPIDMASMNKVKTFDAIIKWMRLKGISSDTDLILTPKLDGMSFCEKGSAAWTRGDGIFGQRSDEHLKAMVNSKVDNGAFKDMVTYGEVIMKRETFFSKYSELFENPRNLVAGALNKKEPTDVVRDLDFVRYGIVNNSSIVNFSKKSEQLEYLNKHQNSPILFEIKNISELSEEYLKNLFLKWSSIYELDGIILEVNDLALQIKLGRETGSNNPCYARAYKGNFEEVKESPYLGITWQVSKQGLLKPVIQIEPIRLDGVTVSNVTGNNAKFICDTKIGKGSVLKVKRSGLVIPLIVSVTVESNDIELPTHCPACKSTDLGWNDAKIEFCCFNPECSGQQLQKIISFFTTLEVDNVSEGVCTQFYEAGYDTIHKILNMSQKDMESLDRFGKRKAEIVYNAIHSKMKNVPLAKLQHATGIFKGGLGTKKLALLESFETKPTFEQVMAIEGYSEISTKAYLDGYDKFYSFIEGLPITVEKSKKIEAVSNELAGASFCFTGVRSKEAEAEIAKKGGKVASGVSKTLTYLVVKEVGSGSSKETKALELGVKVITLEELLKMLQ